MQIWGGGRWGEPEESGAKWERGGGLQPGCADAGEGDGKLLGKRGEENQREAYHTKD